MTRTRRAVAASLLSLLLAAGRADARSAASPDEVCAPGEDPCVVTEPVEVVAGSILDFGTRAVHVTGNGRFDFGSGDGSILCGPFEADTGRPAVVTAGISPFGDVEGGSVTLRSRRLCSGGDPPSPCLRDSDCAVGTCSTGAASIGMNGRVEGRADYPGGLVLEAADSIFIGAPVDLSSTDPFSAGGELTLHAFAGDVAIASDVLTGGGSQHNGGQISVVAGRDALASGLLDAHGGAYDGGFIELLADRDVALQSDVDLSARAIPGYGGALHLKAGRSVMVGDSEKVLRVVANASPAWESSGGRFWFEAGDDIRVDEGVRLIAHGATGYAFGGWLTLDAGGEVDFAGRFSGLARNSYGVGGNFTVHAASGIRIAESAAIDLRGGSGGHAEMLSDNGNVDFGGRLRLYGSGDSGEAYFGAYACRVSLSGQVENRSLDADTRIQARESMRLLPPGRLLTPRGSTVLSYRAAEKPPLLEGTITGSPVLELLPALSGCPVCGNSEIDEGETCDDGNSTGGDGCSSDCLVE